MGLHFVDRYSYLHFATGIIAYYWNISLLLYTVIHILFEYLENTPQGIKFINRYLVRWWPGGKGFPDSMINRTGDVLFGILGWLSAYLLQIS